jgi:hypothetical protein
MNKEQGMSNIEGEIRSKNYFNIHTSPSIFDIPCSLFIILFKKLSAGSHPKKQVHSPEYLPASS